MKRTGVSNNLAWAILAAYLTSIIELALCEWADSFYWNLLLSLLDVSLPLNLAVCSFLSSSQLGLPSMLC